MRSTWRSATGAASSPSWPSSPWWRTPSSWAEDEDGDLLLSVSDNGPGIPPDILDKLNSPDGRIEGGHLGLNNVDSIIRLRCGERYGLSARSVPGEGSRVTLRLPMRKEEGGGTPC